ncbi:hypothetical protein Fmac_026734 [Flemingia macrophylla]|uniref:Uncharacterized protein n=1 Tax=Flemingia macrophylla TaxID=520843 RepID=A0ABD1LHF7_9FABA
MNQRERRERKRDLDIESTGDAPTSSLMMETYIYCLRENRELEYLLNVVDAVQAVKMTNAQGEVKYSIKGINILKAHGKSARDNFLMNGYALNTSRAAQGMPLRVAPAKIACLDFNLQKTNMQLGVQYFVEAGAIVVRRVRKEDMRHVVKATGATLSWSSHPVQYGSRMNQEEVGGLVIAQKHRKERDPVIVWS